MSGTEEDSDPIVALNPIYTVILLEPMLVALPMFLFARQALGSDRTFPLPPVPVFLPAAVSLAVPGYTVPIVEPAAARPPAPSVPTRNPSCTTCTTRPTPW